MCPFGLNTLKQNYKNIGGKALCHVTFTFLIVT